MNVNIWLRWIHVLAGIVWVGQLYFLDLMWLPLQPFLDGSEKSAEVPKVVLRVIAWFRWGAIVSFLSGLLLFGMNYVYTPGVGLGATPMLVDDQGFTERAAWILFGMAVATVMWFNAWFVIRPIQRSLESVDEANVRGIRILSQRSLRAIRTNTILSGPMLFAMLAPSHYGSISFPIWLLVLTVGFVVMLCLVTFARRANSPQ